MHVVHLSAAIELRRDRALHDRVRLRHDDGLDRHAVLRRGLDQREVAHAHQRHLQRARNRRRGEREHVDGRLELFEPLLVHHAEALLFVDHDQAEVAEHDVLLQDAVRSDHDVDFAERDVVDDRARFLLGLEARELFDPDRKRGEARQQGARVLRGEQGRRAQQRDLLLVGDRFEDGADGDLGLAVADVAAH